MVGMGILSGKAYAMVGEQASLRITALLSRLGLFDAAGNEGHRRVIQWIMLLNLKCASFVYTQQLNCIKTGRKHYVFLFG